MPSVISGSTSRQSYSRISVPPTITASEVPASDRLCRNAARMFMLSFAIAQVSSAVAELTIRPRPASATTIQPVTAGGSTIRATAS